MSEISQDIPDESYFNEDVIRKPVRRRKAKKRVKTTRPRKEKVEPDRPVYEGAGDLAGISASKCPVACTEKRCVISTVGVCRHPFLSSDNGCGPVTMANRDRARKLIKHQMIDMKG